MNRLSEESSPYLLQHAHNPVDWYPWGREALEKARVEDKPILVSIGYAACHWCHVMERESFEREDVALLMNAHFVNIKIDREERPDLDHIYMDAVQAMTGSGGWPLHVFLTPDIRPFFGGTYFPPVPAHGRPSWSETLQQVIRAFGEKREEVEAQAGHLTDHLTGSTVMGPSVAGHPPDGIINQSSLDSIYEAIMQQADLEAGGFGRPPKFPQTFTLLWLLRYAHFTGHSEALTHAKQSLDHLLKGGIYDQLGGGLARYSTDRTWLAPHFEKMLYDNALLVTVLCDAFGLTGEPKFGTAIRDILGFVEREWSTKEGGYCSAWDADSEGVEGKYYTWTMAEIDVALGKDAELFGEVYGVTAEGNWEGTNILHLAVDPSIAAHKRGISPEDVNILLEKSKRTLLTLRASRIPPLLDDKQLLSWNALINKSFSQAYAVTGETSFRETAVRHMQFMCQYFQAVGREGPGLGHVYKGGVLKYPAFLDDYAYLISALLSLQEVTADESYLVTARYWTDYVIDHFSEPDTGYFYYTHDNQPDLLFRKKEVYDGAIPSGNAVMANNLWLLSVLFDEPDLQARAEQMLRGIRPGMLRYPTSFGVWADLALRTYYGLNEIVISGERFESLLPGVLRLYIPNRVLQAGIGGTGGFPLLEGKEGGGEPRIYLCRNYVCTSPVGDPGALMEQIKRKTQ